MTATFVERYGLWTDEQHRAEPGGAGHQAAKLDLVRFSFPDQHGMLRGKTLVAAGGRAALRDGVTITSTLLAKDTSHRTVFPVFTPGGGFALETCRAPDFIMVADPATFQVLPWSAHRLGAVRLYIPTARRCPSRRGRSSAALRQLAEPGWTSSPGSRWSSTSSSSTTALAPESRASRASRRRSAAVARPPVPHRAALRPDRHADGAAALEAHRARPAAASRSRSSSARASRVDLRAPRGLPPADTMVLLRSA